MTTQSIPFTREMVRALQRGIKTQTRRLAWSKKPVADGEPKQPSLWQKAKPGDLIWVREQIKANGPYVQYSADKIISRHFWPEHWKQRQKVARYMPKAFSRITLELTEVRRQRLQDITEADALAEGIERFTLGEIRDHLDEPWDAPDDTKLYAAPNDDSDESVCRTPIAAYERLWNIIHTGSVYGDGEHGWDDNPEVVALSFTVHECNIETMPRKLEAA